MSPKIIDVLVVDDEVEICELLCTALTDAGYRVASAYETKSAASIVQESAPPLVICDITMPGKNGLELLEEFKERGFQNAVVILTAHVESPTVVRALRLGAIDYVTKPFSFEEVLAKIPGWLEVGRRLQELVRSPSPEAEKVAHQLRMIELFRLKNQRSTPEAT